MESAALDLMESQGYAATTVAQIAERAGTSSATFFRYFGSKEEVVLADVEAEEGRLTARLASRSDPAQHFAALVEPLVRHAEQIMSGGARVRRSTRLVMLTPELEARSMRIRHRWELAIARQLARETGRERPTPEQYLLANLAVACLTSGLWEWQGREDVDLTEATTRAFARAAELARG